MNHTILSVEELHQHYGSLVVLATWFIDYHLLRRSKRLRYLWGN